LLADAVIAFFTNDESVRSQPIYAPEVLAGERFGRRQRNFTGLSHGPELHANAHANSDANAAGGPFYLTKIAAFPNREQLLRAYPEFAEFIKKKKKYDPQEIFMSQFYDRYR